jgi:hypothetical protein
MAAKNAFFNTLISVGGWDYSSIEAKEVSL